MLESRFAIDEKLVASDERYDGLFVLRTDTNHDAETTANVYKTLWMVEDTFRTAKTHLLQFEGKSSDIFSVEDGLELKM